MEHHKLIQNWYVVHTKSRFENVVHDGLSRKNLAVFLPKITVPSKRRDRKLLIHVPLFPGYIFVKTDLTPHEQLGIVKTVGAVRLIGNKDGPIPVPSHTIQSLKIMVESKSEVYTGTHFQKGDQVVVISGALAGITGIFERYNGRERVIVHIAALGQFAAVNVNERDVEKLS